MRDYCDWGGPSVYGEKEVKARKAHSCVECSALILPGEIHLVYSGCWDGSWSGGRQHLLCRDACVWIRDVLNEECIAFGELSEWWSNNKHVRDHVSYEDWRAATPERRKQFERMWLIGARMYAMICRREKLALAEKRSAA